MNTNLIARLRAEAAILATLAGVWGEYAIQSIQRGQSYKAGYEAAYATHNGNRSLDLSAAADELERAAREAKRLNFIIESERRATLHNNLCPDHRDKVAGKPCLMCELEHSQGALAKIAGSLMSYGSDLRQIARHALEAR